MAATKNKQRNVLSFRDRALLTAWVTNNEKAIADNTDAAAADIASKELQFSVTTPSIANLREALYPDMPRRHQGSPLIPMIEAVKRDMAVIASHVTTLASRLDHLEQSLGGKP